MIELISVLFDFDFYSRLTKDTMNYCVLINKLFEFMGDELIQLEKNK